MKEEGSNRLQEEYENMLRGLRRAQEEREADVVLANPVLPQDILKGAIPGNIRTADHFISFLKRLIEYIKTRLRTQHVIQETPAGFLKDVQQKVCIERKPLRFCAERLASLMRTLEITDTTEFGGLIVVSIEIISSNSSAFLQSKYFVWFTDYTFCNIDFYIHQRIHHYH